MDAKEARLEALKAAWSVELAIFDLDWPRRLLDAAGKAVAVLKLLTGTKENVPSVRLFDRRDECSTSEHADRMVRTLSEAYWTLRSSKLDAGDEIALSAIDEAIETLCWETGASYGYDDFVHREIGGKLKDSSGTR